MKRFRVTLDIDIDEELLAEHVETHKGEKPPYTSDVTEWDGSDIFAAAEEGLLDPRETNLHSVIDVSNL